MLCRSKTLTFTHTATGSGACWGGGLCKAVTGVCKTTEPCWLLDLFLFLKICSLKLNGICRKTHLIPLATFVMAAYSEIIKISSLFPSLIVLLFNKSAQAHVLWMLKGDWLHWSRGKETKTVCFFLPLKQFNPINVLKYLIYWSGGNWSYYLWPIFNLYMSCLSRLWPLMPQVFIRDPVSRSSRLFPAEYSLTKWLLLKLLYSIYLLVEGHFQGGESERSPASDWNPAYKFGPLKMAN